MSPLRVFHRLAALGLVLVVLAPRAAHAQNPAAAEALFEQARAAMAAGSYDIACARFRDSDKLDPAVGTRFNLADCEEHRGRLATAWSLFRGVVVELAQDDDRRPIAEARAAELEPRLPMLRLVKAADAPEGLRASVDGVELGEASFGIALPMDPGSHELRVQAPDGRKQKTSFELQPGQKMELPLALDPELQPESRARATSSASLDPAPPARDGLGPFTQRQWSYIVGGVGAAGVALGIGTGIAALHKKGVADDNCSDATRRCNQTGLDANASGETFAALSSVSFGVGIVGLAAGAYLYLTSKPDELAAAHSSTPEGLFRVRPRVALGPESGFVSVAGRF